MKQTHSILFCLCFFLILLLSSAIILLGAVGISALEPDFGVQAVSEEEDFDTTIDTEPPPAAFPETGEPDNRDGMTETTSPPPVNETPSKLGGAEIAGIVITTFAVAGILVGIMTALPKKKL